MTFVIAEFRSEKVLAAFNRLFISVFFQYVTKMTSTKQIIFYITIFNRSLHRRYMYWPCYAPEWLSQYFVPCQQVSPNRGLHSARTIQRLCCTGCFGCVLFTVKMCNWYLQKGMYRVARQFFSKVLPKKLQMFDSIDHTIIYLDLVSSFDFNLDVFGAKRLCQE